MAEKVDELIKNVKFEGMKASICEVLKKDGSKTYNAWVITFKDGSKRILHTHWIDEKDIENLDLRRQLGQI